MLSGWWPRESERLLARPHAPRPQSVAAPKRGRLCYWSNPTASADRKEPSPQSCLQRPAINNLPVWTFCWPNVHSGDEAPSSAESRSVSISMGHHESRRPVIRKDPRRELLPCPKSPNRERELQTPRKSWLDCPALGPPPPPSPTCASLKSEKPSFFPKLKTRGERDHADLFVSAKVAFVEGKRTECTTACPKIRAQRRNDAIHGPRVSYDLPES